MCRVSRSVVSCRRLVTWDRAYRGWRHEQGFVGPAEVTALGYVTFLHAVRLQHDTRVLLGLLADEADALARFLATYAGTEGP